MRTSKRVCAFLGACLLTISSCLGAEQAKGEVNFESTSPDENGLFSVSLSMRDITFRGFQFVLRYDTSMIVPVDSSGSPATSFSGFGGKAAGTEWLTLVGTALDAAAGKIDFSGFIMPGTKGPGIDDRGQMTVGGEGVKLLSFRFRQLKQGDCGLRLATLAQGGAYSPACPDGIILEDGDGTVDANVSFLLAKELGPEEGNPDESAGEGGGDTGAGAGGSGGGGAGGGTGGSPVAQPTAKELLSHSVLLKVGSHAALVRGGVTAIYPGERQVTAYTRNDRTFVPVRFVAERLGAEVAWENETGTVVIRKDGHTIRMAVGSETYTLDGAEKPMDAPAELRASTDGNARTMVPIRFVAEALGYRVEWDQQRQLAIVSEANYPWDLTAKEAQAALIEADGLLTSYGGFV